MFDFSWGELMLIGAVALIVIGPKELPAVLRAVGQWTTKIKRMASEFQGQFQEAMREAEMADLKKEVDTFTDTAKGFTSGLASQFDPLDTKEATKPKVDSTTDEAKPREAPPASEAVTADGYSAPPAAADAPPMTGPAPPPAAIEPARAASVAAPSASPAATEPSSAASAAPPSGSPGPAEPGSAPPVAPVPEGGRA